MKIQLIHRALAPASDLPAENQIILHAERRQFLKRRWRGIAADGTEFGFDLESRLTDGDVIFHQNGHDYIVRQLTETVYQITCETPAQAALVGWKVGNLHLPAQILENAVLVLHDEAMAQLLAREGWAFSEPVLRFEPLNAITHS